MSLSSSENQTSQQKHGISSNSSDQSQRRQQQDEQQLERQQQRQEDENEDDIVIWRRRIEQRCFDCESNLTLNEFKQLLQDLSLHVVVSFNEESSLSIPQQQQNLFKEGKQVLSHILQYHYDIASNRNKSSKDRRDAFKFLKYALSTIPTTTTTSANSTNSIPKRNSKNTKRKKSTSTTTDSMLRQQQQQQHEEQEEQQQQLSQRPARLEEQHEPSHKRSRLDVSQNKSSKKTSTSSSDKGKKKNRFSASALAAASSRTVQLAGEAGQDIMVRKGILPSAVTPFRSPVSSPTAGAAAAIATASRINMIPQQDQRAPTSTPPQQQDPAAIRAAAAAAAPSQVSNGAPPSYQRYSSLHPKSSVMANQGSKSQQKNQQQQQQQQQHDENSMNQNSRPTSPSCLQHPDFEPPLCDSHADNDENNNPSSLPSNSSTISEQETLSQQRQKATTTTSRPSSSFTRASSPAPSPAAPPTDHIPPPGEQQSTTDATGLIRRRNAEANGRDGMMGHNGLGRPSDHQQLNRREASTTLSQDASMSSSRPRADTNINASSSNSIMFPRATTQQSILPPIPMPNQAEEPRVSNVVTKVIFLPDIERPSFSGSLGRRQQMLVSFYNHYARASSMYELGSRLHAWDPFWYCLQTINCGMTAPVTGTSLPPDNFSTHPLIPKTAVRCSISTKDLRSALEKFQNLDMGPEPSQWKDGHVRLILRLVPTKVSKKPKRADCHLWPKGTFLQVQNTPVKIEQRKQQSHDPKLWKGMCRHLDLGELMQSFMYGSRNERSDSCQLNMCCYDEEQYYYSIAVCQYQSPQKLTNSLLASPDSDYYLERLSLDESIQKAMRHAHKDLVVVDDGDGHDAQSSVDTFVFSLLCPISKVPMIHPVRGKQCKHWQCFDLFQFLSCNAPVCGGRWRCASCEIFVSPLELEYCGLTKAALDRFGEEVTATRGDVEFNGKDKTYRLLPEQKLRYAGGSRKRGSQSYTGNKTNGTQPSQPGPNQDASGPFPPTISSGASTNASSGADDPNARNQSQEPEIIVID